jgi:hypothetical protein
VSIEKTIIKVYKINMQGIVIVFINGLYHNKNKHIFFRATEEEQVERSFNSKQVEGQPGEMTSVSR